MKIYEKEAGLAHFYKNIYAGNFLEGIPFPSFQSDYLVHRCNRRVSKLNFVTFLAIYNNENLPKSMKNCQSRFEIFLKPAKMAKVFQKIAKWSHCHCGQLIGSFVAIWHVLICLNRNLNTSFYVPCIVTRFGEISPF